VTAGNIVEFIRRFLYHVVPLHFVRIRYYGFLSVRSRKVKLALCRDQTGGETIDADALHIDDPTGPRWAPCAVCGSVRMVPIRMIMKYSPWRPEEINVRTARGFNHTITGRRWEITEVPGTIWENNQNGSGKHYRRHTRARCLSPVRACSRLRHTAPGRAFA
jgi:hypothetical protein